MPHPHRCRTNSNTFSYHPDAHFQKVVGIFVSTNEYAKTKIITQSSKKIYRVEFKHIETHNVMQIMKKHDLEIISSNFKEKCQIIFKVKTSKEKKILKNLRRNHKLTINFIKTI